MEKDYRIIEFLRKGVYQVLGAIFSPITSTVIVQMRALEFLRLQDARVGKSFHTQA